jgi:hypothetical protein
LNQRDVRTWKKRLLQPSVITSEDELDAERILLVLGGH